MALTIRTLGHGTAAETELAALLRGARIAAVIDVRSVPKSRAHPHVWAERMAQWVPDLAGASYEWRPELGGFRKTRPDSPNVALRHPSFRGYADYMQTPQFTAALDGLLIEAAEKPTAIMCSETLWWRCHRRLIADALVLLHGVDVQHLMHAGAPQPHRPTPGARVLSNGTLQYDVCEE
ncbi:MAG: DUF488 domain-containing protein [Candidatus Eremiobacteraeota bacterium]|nr:DUF488 domain-containing protein [Candidatus Eremiobacteraeota bacterium]